MLMTQDPREERWRQEAAFFDREASAAMAAVGPVDPRVLHRYGRQRRRRFDKEFRFRLLGDLHGRRVLDVGCGEGTNAITLAMLGARVTGIDISPKAIELAERRAEVNGVASRCTFVCSPLETADLGAGTFDIIWCDAVLHHLIPELEMVMVRLTTWAAPGALMVFGEPINFSSLVRRVRALIPVRTDATPDERPLERAEIALLRRYVPDLKLRHFNLWARLNRFVLPDYNYEESSRPKRAIANVNAVIDYALLSIGPLQRFAGYAVMYGNAPPAR